MCKSIGQPSPHLPFLPSPNCSSSIVQTESYQHQLSQRPQLASSYPLLGGPSKAGKGLTFSVVQVVCFMCSRNSKFWERLSLLCMHFTGLPHRRAKHVACCGRQIECHCTSGIQIRVYYVYMDICKSQPPSAFFPQYSTIKKKRKRKATRGKKNKDNQNCTLTIINNCPITGGNASGSNSQSQTQLVYLYAMLLED